MKLAPIALFVYNRPAHTQKTIEALKNNLLASESDLYIFSDAAKTAKDNDSVAKVQQLINGLDNNSFNKIEIIEQRENLGLANSIITGVTRLVNEYGRVIVMEDDLISSPYCLQYFNDALDFYLDYERVMHIGAYMYPINMAGLPDSFFFRAVPSWAWATWKRAWVHFEPDIEKLYARFDDKKISDFSIDHSENFWKQVNEYRAAKINSWAIRWYASVFLAGGLSLWPSVSFINNIGNDASGTHSDATDMYHNKELCNRRISDFPKIIEENNEAYKRIKHFYRTRKGSWLKRGMTFLRTWSKKLFRK